MDVTEFYWGMYQEHTAHARQHEEQRERMTGAVAALGAVVVAVATTDNVDMRLPMVIAGWMLVTLGVYGAVFSLKHYERYRQHVTYAAQYRAELERLLPEIPKSGTAFRKSGRERHLRRRLLFRALAAVRLHWLWSGLPLLIALGGALLIVAS